MESSKASVSFLELALLVSLDFLVHLLLGATELILKQFSMQRKTILQVECLELRFVISLFLLCEILL